jgi:hypothetical protein
MLKRTLCPGWQSNQRPQGLGCKKGRIASDVLKGDIRRRKMNTVPATIAKDRGDGFGLSIMAEMARHVGLTTSRIAKAVGRLEEEG